MRTFKPTINSSVPLVSCRLSRSTQEYTTINRSAIAARVVGLLRIHLASGPEKKPIDSSLILTDTEKNDLLLLDAKNIFRMRRMRFFL